MSQIASFYILPQTDSAALLAASKPDKQVVEKKGLLFNKKKEVLVDRFWDFLRANAQELEAYGYSGVGFCDLDLVLEDMGFMLFDAGSKEISTELSETRETSIALFSHDEALAANARLEEIGLKEQEIRKFYREENPPGDEALGTEAVMAAYQICRQWLRSVEEDKIGLLIVG